MAKQDNKLLASASGTAGREGDINGSDNDASHDWIPDGMGYARVPIPFLEQPGISDEQRRVYLALASFADGSGKCFPLRKTLARRANMHPSNVSESITRMCRLGWLSVSRRGGRSSQYQLTIPEEALALHNLFMQKKREKAR